ncbi:MAG: pimeloyl-ACP methyl ester carboxylesterase [Psychromonas sp.]|jgi:pimeloyl-ACP methyl ester carboxylesterase
MNLKNQIYYGAQNKASLVDLTVPINYRGELIIFLHGYMGYKDWGCWNLVEEYFTDLGFAFCKYNTSHNGCSPERPTEFVDLEAFGKNTYTNELQDLAAVKQWLQFKLQPIPKMNVIGHSRGGGIALLGNKILTPKKTVTWAAISDIASRFPTGKDLLEWKELGVRYYYNGRTKQNIPLEYSQYTSYLEHKDELDIKKSAKNLVGSVLHIHGDADTSVDISEGKALSQYSNSKLHTALGCNHTFGSQEPWLATEMSVDLQKLCKLTAEFILTN